MNVIKEATQDPSLRKQLGNPYAICPPEHSFYSRQPDVRFAQYDEDFQAWAAPFVMAAINTRIVHRSNALSGNAYGKDFLYDEGVLTGRGLKGRLAALGMVGALGSFMAAAAVPPSRWVLERFVVPKPGEGPSPEAQEKGFFDIRLFGKTAAGQTLRVKVTGDRDPGYGSTAKMLGQAGACLALDIAKQDKEGGFWTPSTILGDKLLDRLQQHAGLTFEVIED